MHQLKHHDLAGFLKCQLTASDVRLRARIDTHAFVFDSVSKFQIEQYAADFANWLIGEPIALTRLEPTELSNEPIRADSLILLQSSDLILHCEFQTDTDEKMPFRMADYRLRVYRKFPSKRMVQVVIYLRQSASELVYRGIRRDESHYL